MSPAKDESRKGGRSAERFNQAVQDAADALPDVTGHPSLANIKAAFSPLSPEEALLAVTRKLLERDASEVLRDRERQSRKLGIVLDLHQNLTLAAQSLVDRSEDLKKVLVLSSIISEVPLMQQRMLRMSGSNIIVRHFDDLAVGISRQCGQLFAVGQAADKYLVEAKAAHEELMEGQTLEDKLVKLDLLEEHVSAFTGVLYDLEEQFAKLPGFCTELAESIRTATRKVSVMYGPEEPDKKDSRPKSFFDMFGGDEGPRNLNLPLYRENIYLTAYLHGLIEKVPVLDSQADVPKKLSRDPDVARFVEHLRIHSDTNVYTHINSKSLYAPAAECLEKLHVAAKGIYLAVKSTNIWNVLRDERRSVTAGYNRIAEQVDDSIVGHAAALRAYENFDPGLLLDGIRRFSPTPKDADREKGGPKPRPKKRRVPFVFISRDG